MDSNHDSQLATKLISLAQQLIAIADSVAGSEYEITPQLATRFTEFEKAGKCLHCGLSLGNDASKRGLHINCYQLLHQRISRGKATDKQLVEEGRMLPKGQKGGRPLKPLPPLPSLEPDQQLATDVVAEAKADAKKLASTRKSPPNENGGRKRAKSDTDGAR